MLNCPSFMSASLDQRYSVPSLINHVYHLLSTHILCPSKKNTRALSYIGSIKSHKTFMKYIQQLISGGNL